MASTIQIIDCYSTREEVDRALANFTAMVSSVGSVEDMRESYERHHRFVNLYKKQHLNLLVFNFSKFEIYLEWFPQLIEDLEYHHFSHAQIRKMKEPDRDDYHKFLNWIQKHKPSICTPPPYYDDFVLFD
jgi:hypothetical protein